MPRESEYTRYLSTLKAVGDSLRADILRLLARDSFGVLELAHILDISQPALSHHLKILTTAGLLTTRRDGTSIFYRRRTSHEASMPYRSAVLDALDTFPLEAALAKRRDEIHQERAARSRAFFRDNAKGFREQHALICGPDVYLPLLPPLLPQSTRHAIDVGPGDGEALSLLSRHFERVHGIDNSSEMLARARQRIDAERLDNVVLRETEFTEVKRPRANLVLMAMVLHHAPSPAAFIAHAASLLARGGRLIVVELVKHAQTWARDACGDLWLGFDPDEITAFGCRAGLEAHDPQYLAQRNGFRIQIHTFESPEGARQ